MRNRVFITDGHWRKALAAVRSLGSKGIDITVGETTRLTTAAFSKYCTRSVVYPSPVFDPDEFIDFLLRELSHRHYRMLLPMEDESLLLISRHRSAFSRLTYLPVASFKKISFARNKDKVITLAQKIGVPVPKTWHIENLSQIDGIKNSLPYPVVIKPRVSSGALGTVYSKNQQELTDMYLSVHQKFPFPMIQEQIPRSGPGFGASFLIDENGRTKASFVHKRLREYPVTGGASTLRESTIYDDIKDMARSLLNTAGWFGVAMVEFKYDPRDKTPKLMEINPRFWGSLSLSLAAGVDFPYLLYRMSRGENFKPVEDYTSGVRCRWLLPGDLLHFIYNPKRSNLLPEFFKFWDKNTAYDILSSKDPLPVLGRILTPLTFLYDRDMKRRMNSRKK